MAELPHTLAPLHVQMILHFRCCWPAVLPNIRCSAQQMALAWMLEQGLVEEVTETSYPKNLYRTTELGDLWVERILAVQPPQALELP